MSHLDRTQILYPKEIFDFYAQSTMKEKVLAIIFILVGLGIGWIALQPEESPAPQVPPIKTLHSLITDNIRAMNEQQLIPKEWGEIQYVAYNFHSEQAKKMLGNQKIKIPESPQGKFRLEMDFIDVEDEKDPAILLQLSLFELERNNKFWEHSQNIGIREILPEKKNETPETKKPGEENLTGSK